MLPAGTDIRPPDHLPAGLPGSGGFRVACRYDGHDLHTVLNLVAAGHGLTVLPVSAAARPAAGGTAAVPLSAPRVVHRVEALHGALAGGRGGGEDAVAALVAQLRQPPSSTPPGTPPSGS